MNVLIACEESQEVCKAFRLKGHNAFSCDIQECSGGHPEWHIKANVLDVIFGNCRFNTMDDKGHVIYDWDLIIAHPPCTYLSTAATASHSLKKNDAIKILNRTMLRIEAINFFMTIATAPCKKICIENPQGIMSSIFRQPDQYVHPYYFADSENDIDNYACKKTGLWLKGLSPLTYDIKCQNPMEKAEHWSNGKRKSWTETRHGSILRSKTFPGIAKAMAEQWGEEK